MDAGPIPEPGGHGTGSEAFRATTTALLLPWGSSEHQETHVYTPKAEGSSSPPVACVSLRPASEGYRYPAGIARGNSGKQTVINRAGTLPHLTDVEMHLGRRKRRRERRAGEERWLPRALCCSLPTHPGGCSGRKGGPALLPAGGQEQNPLGNAGRGFQKHTDSAA